MSARLMSSNLSYRHNGHARIQSSLHVGSRFKAVHGVTKPKFIAEMEEISDKREDSQPVKSRTGGSTFKNPDGADPEGLESVEAD